MENRCIFSSGEQLSTESVCYLIYGTGFAICCDGLKDKDRCPFWRSNVHIG